MKPIFKKAAKEMAFVAIFVIAVFVYQWIKDPYEVTAFSEPSILVIFGGAIVIAWCVLYLPHILADKLLPDGKLKTALLKRRS